MCTFKRHPNNTNVISLDLYISVGNSKILQGPQEFVSEVIGGIGIVGESEYASKRDKPQENYPVVSRSRRQNFTIENENANENAHLSRLYPLQMDELLEQKQIVPTPNLQVLDAPLKPRLKIDKSINTSTRIRGDMFRSDRTYFQKFRNIRTF